MYPRLRRWWKRSSSCGGRRSRSRVGWCGEFPDDPEMRVSHETIYQSLFVQSRGALRKELTRYLRTGHVTRRSAGPPRLQRTARVRSAAWSTSANDPAEAEDRAVPGHWEGDLIFGTRHQRGGDARRTPQPLRDARRAPRRSHRRCRRRRARRQDRRAARRSCGARSPGTKARRWPRHARFTVATGVPVYFCDPRSPWQRGTNENTNGLLRQYFPQTQPLAHSTQADLDAVAAELNGRPRQTLGWQITITSTRPGVAMTP